jgi:NAD(P)-dependent dehydrogenase (short-subunit alcohol dehydrogenase family)
MRTIHGKVAVVTGAGSGIGRATALALVRKGAIVALADINPAGIQETARQIAALGGRSSEHVVDVASRGQMEAFAQAVEAQHGRVDIVVNNAGIGILEDFADSSLEDFEKVVDINLWGVVYGSKFFLPALRRQGGGHIVNISSLAGIISTPGMVSYGTTKFAVRGFSESLRAELASYNIGVTSVHPGMIRTNIAKVSRCADTALQQRMVDWFERFGRPPEQVADKIVRAILDNQMRVLVTPETYVMDLFKRAAPAVAEGFNGLLMHRLRKWVNPARGSVPLSPDGQVRPESNRKAA